MDSPTQTLNGYPLATLAAHLSQRLAQATPDAVRARLQQVPGRIAAHVRAGAGPIHLSLGETCGPAIRLKEAGLPTLGAGFFDNLVVTLDDATALIRSDFAGLLHLPDLTVARWEEQDSVLDTATKIFFHHQFHVPGEANEKSHQGPQGRRRRIDAADIPLFLGIVAAQFAYLAEKFRLVLRAPVAKVLVLRTVDGAVVDADRLDRLHAALTAFGAVDIRVWAAAESGPAPGHLWVPERGTRWGAASTWRSALASIS